MTLAPEAITTPTFRCVHFVSRGDQKAAATQARRSGFAVFEVDAQSIETKEHLLPALARAMNFPEYFAPNWDAFDECLRDMSWSPARGYILVLRGAEHFWSHSSRLAAALVMAWLLAAEEWHSREVGLHLIFVWEGDG